MAMEKQRWMRLLLGTATLGFMGIALPASADQATPETNTQSVQVTNQPQTATDSTTSPTVTVANGVDKYSKPIQEPDFWYIPEQYQTDIPVQFLGINDLHGGLDTKDAVTIGQRTYQNAGTVARLSSYLNQAQEQFKDTTGSDNSIRLEAGDAVGASPANSALLAHEPTMHALKAMNFDIATLGNHEFDRGLPEFNRILTGGQPAANADELVKEYPHENSGLDMVVANVVRADNGQIPYGYKPYEIRNVSFNGRDARVGFIGLETSTLPTLTIYDNYKDYKVLDEAETIAKYDKILRSRGVNAIVVVAHTGVKTDPNASTTGPTVDILQKLNAIDPDNKVGLYVAAHSHQYANAKVGKTHVVQAVYTGKAYDDTWAYVNPDTGEFDHITSHVYPVLSKEDDPATKDDANVAAIVADADHRIAKKANAVIGYAQDKQTITGRLHNTASMENQAGELVAKAQLYEATKQGFHPDFAMTNTGSIRSDLEVNPADGAVTWSAAAAVQPFGNILKVVEMKGQDIRQALNQQYMNGQRLSLQIAGLHYTYTKQDNPDQPFVVLDITKDDGTKVQDDQTYQVVANEFLQGGGDYFTAFKKSKVLASAGSDTDIFVQYLKDMSADGHKIQTPTLDRKIYV
ncbi:5'-nucleotidase [Leuconostocaceae bacterium R-53105]|uniref:5'-nucleotidase n=2 Tax=Convivina intestini TaxID=1505726 RepID=A0A2U1DEK4_9LACO|nr:5'-nucleotidase [Convivina intestini]CAH1851463.1 Cell wall protein [Convivina intestini]CAH1853074.1 Cell wall protein [Convivina intestini]SDB80838.1 5'-nucleotidase [Leuconostocaceae bacterium R-53105]